MGSSAHTNDKVSSVFNIGLENYYMGYAT